MQSIPDSVEKHSTCPSVHRARFESCRRSQCDRSMCFSSIDGKAPRSPVIKTDCQMAIKVMDLPGATSMSWLCGRQTIHAHIYSTQVNTRHIFSLWWHKGSAGCSCYQTRCGRWVVNLEILSLYVFVSSKQKSVPFKQRFVSLWVSQHSVWLGLLVVW